jgi:hypothetical protein
MVDVSKCFVGETINWPDTNQNASQLIKPPKDHLVDIPQIGLILCL